MPKRLGDPVDAGSAWDCRTMHHADCEWLQMPAGQSGVAHHQQQIALPGNDHNNYINYFYTVSKCLQVSWDWGWPFLAACFPLCLPSAKAELQQQRWSKGEHTKLRGAAEQSEVVAKIVGGGLL